MKKARLLWPVVTVAVIAAGTFGLVLFVWRSTHRSDLATFWSFAAAVVVVAVGLIGRTAGVLSRAGSVGIRRTGGDGGGQTLDEGADLLAEAVKEQWTRAAADRWLLQAEPIPVRWARPSQPVTGPVSAAVGSRQFSPLPGLTAVRQGQLRNGGLGDLHTLYGGLGSGRIVIVGAPGSGKSGAAVLLILAALRHREQVPEACRPLVPVPVMFTMHGWDPNIQRLGDWLAVRLRQAYPLFADTRGAADAGILLGSGRIAVILDGLDEIPDELQPVALRALSQQAVFRVVVLSRSAEMAAAARQCFLEGAVALELQDVDSPAAAGYLTRVQRDPPPPGWSELTGRLRHAPDSPIAKALSNPLTLTLVRDTYRDTDVHELLDFCGAAGHCVSREDIEDHLLDRVLPVAYTPHPGEVSPRYEFQAAQRALSYVATRMNQDGERDLAWWRIPTWTSRTPRIIAGGLVAGLGFGILGMLVFDLVIGLLSGQLIWILILGPALALIGGLVAARGARGGGYPGRMAPLRWQVFSRSSLMTGLVTGLVVVLLGGFVDGLVAGLRVGLMDGLVTGLVAGLRVGLVVGLVAGFVAGLVAGLVDGLHGALVVGLMVGLGTGLMTGLVSGLTTSLSRPEAIDTSPLTPLAAWRRDQASKLVGGLVGGLVVGLMSGLGFMLFAWIGGVLSLTLVFVLSLSVFGLTVGLVFALARSETWPVSLAFVQLAQRRHTPVRLLQFLEDARERQVLRTVGPVYQFRHARLQDRLAGLERRTSRQPHKDVTRP